MTDCYAIPSHNFAIITVVTGSVGHSYCMGAELIGSYSVGL